MSTNISTKWSKQTRTIVGVGLVIFGLALLYISRSVLAMIILAALIAFLLNPIIHLFQRRLKFPRGAAVATTYILAGLVVLLAPLIFLPPVIEGLNYLADIDYQLLVENVVGWIESSLVTMRDVDVQLIGLRVNLEPLAQPAIDFLQNNEPEVAISMPSFDNLVNSVWSGITVTFGVATNLAGSVFTGLFTVIIMILSAVYISLGADKYHAQFLNVIPRPYHNEVNRLLNRLGFIWQAYLRGQLKLMLSIGIVTWIGLYILGMPGAFILGVIAGLMELIPNLGPILAAVPAVVVALLQGSTYLDVNNLAFALIIIGFYVLVQQFENTFVVPRVLGHAVELPPLVVILGVWIGATVWGILGALLAAPVIASGREIVWYLYMKVLGEDPFPNPPIPKPEPRPPMWEQLKFLAAKAKSKLSGTPNPETVEVSKAAPDDSNEK